MKILYYLSGLLSGLIIGCCLYIYKPDSNIYIDRRPIVNISVSAQSITGNGSNDVFKIDSSWIPK